MSPFLEHYERHLRTLGSPPEEQMFRPGDAVQLKGDPCSPMVIRDYSPAIPGYVCVWFDINGHVQTGKFRGWELEPRGASTTADLIRGELLGGFQDRANRP